MIDQKELNEMRKGLIKPATVLPLMVGMTLMEDRPDKCIEHLVKIEREAMALVTAASAMRSALASRESRAGEQ